MHIQKACPSGRPYFKKMYTFAGIFFRWFYAYTCMHPFSSLPALPAFFQQWHIHRNTTPTPTALTDFSHILFALLFLRKPERQAKTAVKNQYQAPKISYGTKREEKSCKRKNNRHPLQFYQVKEKRDCRRTNKKTEKTEKI